MKLDKAATYFAKLGHPLRLAILRELVKVGNDGLNTGLIGKKFNVPNSTLTHHIRELESVGLIKRKQASQCLICHANLKLIQQLSDYLLEACCSESTLKSC